MENHFRDACVPVCVCDVRVMRVCMLVTSISVDTDRCLKMMCVYARARAHAICDWLESNNAPSLRIQVVIARILPLSH